MFGQCRSVIRRVACQNLVDRPLAQGSHLCLSSDVGRDHHKDPGGSDGTNEDKKKPNGNGCYCPYMLGKSLFECVGVASVCIFLGLDIRRDILYRSSLRKQWSEFSGPSSTSSSWWYEFFVRNTRRKLFASVLGSASASPRPVGFSEQEFKAISEGAGNALNNMIGVALIKSGSAEDGVKFLEQGTDGRSLYNLGVAHETGDVGGKPDHEKAFTYYEKGAALGHDKSTFNIAVSYLTGKGTDVDIPRGKQLLEKAQEMGVPEAAGYIKLLQNSNFLNPSPYPSSGLHSSSSAPNMTTFGQDINSMTCDPYSYSRDLHKDDDAISFDTSIKTK